MEPPNAKIRSTGTSEIAERLSEKRVYCNSFEAVAKALSLPNIEGEMMASDEELMRIARKRAEEKVGFYTHFTIYVAVNLLLVLVWWFSGAGFPWFIFVLVFWGIGIVAHGASVFVGTGMTDRMVASEYEKLKKGRE